MFEKVRNFFSIKEDKKISTEEPSKVIPVESTTLPPEEEVTIRDVITEQSASEQRLLDDPTIVGYLNREDQATTFNTLTSLGINFSNDSLLDVGCGIGDMYAFLYEIKMIDEPNYYGIDYNPNMIMLAKEKYQKVRDRFSTVDLLNYDSSDKKDWVIAANVFNLNMQTDMNAYLIACIDKMYESCNKGIAFNLIGTHCEAELVAEAVKYDVKEIIDYCIKKYKRVVLRTDYLYDEFTIYLYK